MGDLSTRLVLKWKLSALTGTIPRRVLLFDKPEHDAHGRDPCQTLRQEARVADRDFWGCENTSPSPDRRGGATSQENLYSSSHHITELTSVQKIMLDTNQYDRLLAAPETYNRLLRLLSEGKIELLTTHIQRDEIMAVGDVEKKARLEALLGHAHLIGTRGAVFGISKFGLARFGSDEDHDLIAHIRGTAWERKTEDALIAATASKDADTFVTNDERLSRRLKSYPSTRCEVIDFEEFESRLIDLTP